MAWVGSERTLVGVDMKRCDGGRKAGAAVEIPIEVAKEVAVEVTVEEAVVLTTSAILVASVDGRWQVSKTVGRDHCWCRMVSTTF